MTVTRRALAAGLAVVAVYGRDEGRKDFSEALYILKLDGKVRRNSWPAEEFLFVKRDIDEDGKEHLTILRGSDDGMWRPEQADLLAEDWAEVAR
jgi:hypothetical protein